MGFWDFWNSTTDAVKRDSPDLTPVTNKLKENIPGPEDREKIRQNVTQFGYDTATHPATKEALNLAIPGGAQWFNVVRALLNNERHVQSVEDDKKYEILREEIKKLQEMVQEQNNRNNMLLERIIKGLESPSKKV